MDGLDLVLPRVAPDLKAPVRAAAVSPEAARQAAREFEQMVLGQLLMPMFDALPTDGPFGGGHGEAMFRSFQVDAYAKAIVRQGGIGLTDAVARELITLQEKANGVRQARS